VTKKAWKTPELVVLVRGEPEEAVLSNCKGTANPSAKKDTKNTGCAEKSSCGICSAIVAS